jgi:hypothetical protein
MPDNILPFPVNEGMRKQVFTSACGSTVTIEVPAHERPLTVEQAIYLLSDAQYRIHMMMYKEGLTR